MFPAGFVGLHDASGQTFDNVRIETLEPLAVSLGPVFFDNFDGGLTVAPGVGALLDGAGAPESVLGYAGIGNGGNTFGGDFLRNDTGAYAGAGGELGDPGDPTRLTLTGLPPHAGVDLNFLFAKIATWDGGSPGEGCSICSPDIFEIRVDGDIVFAESIGFNQPSFQPAPGIVWLVRQTPLGFSDFDGAFDMGPLDQLGSIPHSSDTLVIEWRALGAGWQGGVDESWAIDNVEIILTDKDTDFDGFLDTLDNCPAVANPLQTDSNGDGYGDACVDPSVTIPDNADVDPSASIGAGATVNQGVVIEENVVVGDNVGLNQDSTVGADSIIGANSTVDQGTSIGSGTTIGNDVTLRKDVTVGGGVTIGSNVSIGRDSVICDGATIGDSAVLEKNVLVEIDGEVLAGALIAKDTVVAGPGGSCIIP
jgi:acetyltransferase-like isoleucine patch superfamily enzyme